MNPITTDFNPYRTHFFTLINETINVKTEDGRTLNLNNFAGLSIEQSNLMVVLKQPLPESEFPLVERIISSYENSKHANNVYLSLCAAILRGERFWDVNVNNQYIPYKAELLRNSNKVYHLGRTFKSGSSSPNY